MAAQAAPLSRGLTLGVTVFAYPENFVTKRKISHTTTSAKTRATAMLQRQHIPPNVVRNPMLTNMIEWFRNITWSKDIEETFEQKLKRARGGYSKAQYLRMQASYLLDTEDFGNIGEKLMIRLFHEFPNESFSVIFGHEQLGDYYTEKGQFDLAEAEYKIVVEYYHSQNRGGTTGLADIKLADLYLCTEQNQKFEFAYKLITDDFIKSKGRLNLNSDKYFYYLTLARLSNRLGYISNSKEYARLAMSLSEVVEPQFARHKTVGLVNAKKNELKELELILK